MDPTIDLGTALTGAASTFFTSINGALGPAIAIAVPLIALFAGWKIFRRFTRG